MQLITPEEKLDFDNLDVRLYISLRDAVRELEEFAKVHGTYAIDKPRLDIAKYTLRCFEQSAGPLPDWAIARNFGYEIKEGTQLLTRDGRRMGNAYIVKHEMAIMPELADRNNPYGEVPVFHCLTDAGSKFTMMEKELLGQFHIGDWLCDPARIIRDFDRNGEFMEEPK